jgi:hypothetical protein
VAVGDFGLAGFDGFRADLTGKIFQADFAIAMHEHEEGASLMVLMTSVLTT